ESSRRDERWRRLVCCCRPHGRCRTRGVRSAHGAIDRARHAAHRLAGLLFQRGRCRRAPRRRCARNPVLCLGFRREVQRGRDQRLRVVVCPRGNSEPLRAVQSADQVRCSVRPGLWRWVSIRWPTGHYARLSGGRLRRAVDRDKDQSYVLAVLTAQQLRHAAFPIGDTPKRQIRAEAARRGLAVANKPDSHDICFIPSGNTRAFLGERIGVRRGVVVDADGVVLASHDGVHGFTIGQRRGLGIAGPGPNGRPRYVTAIDADTATVHVGDVTDLDVQTLTGRAPVFTAGAAPSGPVDCVVQVRAHGETVSAVAELIGDALFVQLHAPLRGVARGQTLVLYRPDPAGDEVLGSATIAGASGLSTGGNPGA
ncbi:LOW QUALITY PROTEIN: tRNA (5-methylaminomethyl-2-thiouridylate)-methyltransferase trmU, partial [Mycobacterium tuberculosis variant africanum K85]